MASLVLRGNTWHLAWRWRGKQYSESTGVLHDGKDIGGKPRPPSEAKRALHRKEAELDKGRNLTRITLDELLSLAEADYENSGYKSLASFKCRLPHIREYFGMAQARTITEADLIDYKARRGKAGAAPATINRELEVIGKALHLGYNSGKVDQWIRIKKVKDRPPRKGFFDDAKIAAVIRHLPDYLRAPVMFGYLTGWRRSEVFGLQWKDVDFASGEVRLSDSKSGKPRVFKMTPALRSLLSVLAEARRSIAVERQTLPPETNMERPRVVAGVTQFVFVHRRTERYGGKALPIADFRKAWDTACKAAGCPGMLFHDLRRSAARNLEMQGNSRSLIMAAMGHETEAMFHRYRIVGPDDMELSTPEGQAESVVNLLEVERPKAAKFLKKKA